MDVDMFGLGLLRWVRESVLSSKAPHRGRVKFVLDGDEDGKGKGKMGDACLNLAMTKRPDGVDDRDAASCFFYCCTTWNVCLMLCFSPDLVRRDSGLFDFLE